MIYSIFAALTVVLVSFIGIIYILQNTIFEGPPPMQYTPPDAPVIPPK